MKYLFQEHSPTFHHDSGINRHCQKDDDSDKNADTTTAKMLTEKLRECTHIHLGTHFLRAQSEKDKGDNHTYEHIEHAKPLNTHTKSSRHTAKTNNRRSGYKRGAIRQRHHDGVHFTPADKIVGRIGRFLITQPSQIGQRQKINKNDKS